MKVLTIIIALITGFSVTAQIKTTTTATADGSKSASFSLELGKPSTTITAQVNFEYPNGITPEPLVYKKGGNRKTYILVANETVAGMSKFEIDIFTGNKTLSKSTLLVWLSATSPSKGSLTNGTYNYSTKGPAERQEYEFSGTVKLGDVDVPITGGSFSVSSWDKRIAIKYNLTLNNGVKTTGEYNSDYEKEDRRKL
ncbi:hypothetical protein [Pedobacter psychroterrae]|uniref:Lipocalin-like domain-containing protein n=1 Tax=Pedobacter psychroterrae TaxID=2530453 RepID=A0A4R0NCY6_9SPHI|nr:hypothetical protein [Pedobacter psychroterrae]TCC98209.1 hypothetical protein EZ437_18635 [Pedobacter psychroterrae]